MCENFMQIYELIAINERFLCSTTFLFVLNLKSPDAKQRVKMREGLGESSWVSTCALKFAGPSLDPEQGMFDFAQDDEVLPVIDQLSNSSSGSSDERFRLSLYQ